MVSKDEFLAELGYMRIPQLSESTRQKVEALIKSEFPYLWEVIRTFAKDHNLHEGDVAGKVLIDYILP